MKEKSPIQEKPLPEEELTREARRLIVDLTNCVRQLPEFQHAFTNILFDGSGMEEEDAGSSPARLVLPLPKGGVPFTKDRNIYTFKKGALLVIGDVDAFVDISKMDKNGIETTIYILLEHDPGPTKIKGEISFSQVPRGGSRREERLENTRSAVEKIDQFIKDLNPLTPVKKF